MSVDSLYKNKLYDTTDSQGIIWTETNIIHHYVASLFISALILKTFN